MSDLNQIISINISRETATVAQTDFNTVLFITPHTQWPERARVYTSLTGVGADFATTSSAYAAATRAFGQKLKPKQFIIGRRQIPAVTVSVAAVANTTLYTITVSGTVYNYTSTGSATAIDIAMGLAAAYDLDPIAGVTVTDNLDGTLSVSSSVDWSITSSANLEITTASPTETWVDSLEAVQAENDEWYALTVDTQVKADLLALAAAIEAQDKLFGVGIADTAAITTADTDFGSAAQDLTYYRTFGIYGEASASEYPAVAVSNYRLQQLPGGNTWNQSTLVGVTPSKLTPTAITNLSNKNYSYYKTISDLNVMQGAKTFGGEWIDVMVGVDWLKARIQERIFFRMYNSPKIPYDNSGFAIIEAEIRSVLDEGIRNRFLAATPAPQVFVPDALSIHPNTRGQRRMEGITFTARLAGAAHFVDIQGSVTP